MKIIFLMFILLAVPALTAILTRLQIVRPLKDRGMKRGLIIATLLVGIIGELHLIFFAVLPFKTDIYIAAVSADVKRSIDFNYPDASSQPIDSEELKELLDDRRFMTIFINGSKGKVFIIDFLGTHAFLSGFEHLNEETETMFEELESRNIPATLHNIVDYSMNRARTHVDGIVDTAMIVTSIMISVCFSLIMLFYYSSERKKFRSEPSGTMSGFPSDRR